MVCLTIYGIFGFDKGQQCHESKKLAEISSSSYSKKAQRRSGTENFKALKGKNET